MTAPNASWATAIAPRLYEELKALARLHLRRERPDHTFGPTALVHEAWLRFSASDALPPTDASRFFAIASTTMRRVLIDHARRIHSDKRGGGVAAAPLDSVEAYLTVEEADELVALDEALERLAALQPRVAEVVVMRFFGGLTERETADALGIAPKTVQRDWLAARAWLRKEMAADLGLRLDRDPPA